MGKVINGIIICSYILYSNLCYSTECLDRVQPITEGQVAQCKGFLFSPSAEEDAYKATQISTLQKEENEILNRRLELYMKESDVLAKEVSQRNNTEGLYRVCYFALGVLVTGYIASNVKR